MEINAQGDKVTSHLTEHVMEVNAVYWATAAVALMSLFVMKTALAEGDLFKGESYRTEAVNFGGQLNVTLLNWFTLPEAQDDFSTPREDFEDGFLSAKLQRSALLLSHSKMCKPYLYCAPKRCPQLDQPAMEYTTGNGLEEIDIIGWRKPEVTAGEWRYGSGVNHTGSYEKAACQDRDLVGVFCSCDRKCVRFGDCCIDAFTSCFNLHTNEEIVEFIQNTTRLNASEREQGAGSEAPLVGQAGDWMLTDYVTCEVVKEQPEIKVLMVSTCPTHARHNGGSDDQSKLASLPPVTLKDQQITFKNVNCALCHGADVRNLLAWPVIFFCQGRTLELGGSFHDNQSSVSCSKEFVAPGVCMPRFCRSETKLATEALAIMTRHVSEGLCTWQDEVLCKSYFFPTNETKNPHCRACLEPETKKRRSADEYVSVVECKVFDDKSILGGGIHVILDIFGRYVNHVADASVDLCSEDHVYDDMGHKCVRLKCPPGYTTYRGTCRRLEIEHLMTASSQIFPDRWEWVLIKFEVTGPFNVSLLNLTQWAWLQNVCLRHSENVIRVAENIEGASRRRDSLRARQGSISRVGNYDDLFNCNASNTPFDRSDQCASIITRATVTMPIEFVVQLSQFEESNILHELEIVTRALLEVVDEQRVSSICLTNAPSMATCPDGTLAESVRHAAIHTKDASVFARVNTTQSVLLFPFLNVGFELRPSASFSLREGVPLDQIFICDADESIFKENCTVVGYRLNETVFNGTHVKVPSGAYFSQGSFLIKGAEVLVCSDFKFVTAVSTNRVDQTFLLLSMCVTGLSCLLLLAMVVAYCALPELRTLPGKLIASLALTMMLTFAGIPTTLLDIRHEVVCPMFAIFNHLVALSHFGWMSAVAVNMALNFGFTFPVEPLSSRCTFRKYCLSVWGAAVLFVVPPVILYFSRHSDPPSHPSASGQADDNFPRYGHPLCGWFSGPTWARLAFVIAPYLLSLAISVGGYVLTVVGIHRARKGGKRLGKQRSQLMSSVIFLKLSTAMGFFWTLSILLSVLDEDRTPILSYLALVLVLLQGALLFLAFMVNRRVYELIVRVFSLRWGHATKATPSSSTVPSKSISNSKSLRLQT